MRTKLNNKTKVIFVVFAAMIAGVVGLFAYAMTSDFLQDEEHIELRQGAIIYDQNSLPMETVEPGTISLKWTGDYYYNSESKSVKVNLGKNTIASDGDSLYIIGGGYKINTDASVVKLDNFYETNINDSQFYKLCDRRYLLISEEIKDDNELVDTQDYLYILLDKQGNAQLVNNLVNGKTQVPSILNSEDYNFDIANEILNIGTSFEIDMKDVIGTTNEFDPQTYVDANTGETNLNPEELDIEVEGGDGGTGGTGGEGGIGGVGGTGGTGGRGSNAEQADIVKEIMLLGVERGTTTLTVKYHASDPFAQYGLIYIALYDGNTDITNSENKRKYIENSLSGVNTYNNSMIFKDLTPGTTYQIVIGHIADADEDEWYVDDVIKTSTYAITNSLEVYSQTETNIYLKLKLDEYYDNYQFGRVTFWYNVPNESGVTLQEITDARTSFTVIDSTIKDGVDIVIPYDKTAASSYELFTYQVQLSQRATFVNDETPPKDDFIVAVKASSVNGYFDKSKVDSHYTVTFKDGLSANVVKELTVTQDNEGKYYLAIPAALDPNNLGLESSAKFGLIFMGWQVQKDGSYTDETVYTENDQVELSGDTKELEAKAVWSCVLNATFADSKCTCTTGYHADYDLNACVLDDASE